MASTYESGGGLQSITLPTLEISKRFCTRVGSVGGATQCDFIMLNGRSFGGKGHFRVTGRMDFSFAS